MDDVVEMEVVEVVLAFSVDAAAGPQTLTSKHAETSYVICMIQDPLSAVLK